MTFRKMSLIYPAYRTILAETVTTGRNPYRLKSAAEKFRIADSIG